ncbi:hypothetical protein B0T10DRAFT_208709 [Thelonectria olida]|uniref:DUF7892 domain-containing protein n=1 Tax=Thelonectria olida TaxID=1576542 RepID=A0A9P8WC39_9HYPO|nr:hypothetical protein B0T10DRAFT_208709 [Thelonectria olida]
MSSASSEDPEASGNGAMLTFDEQADDDAYSPPADYTNIAEPVDHAVHKLNSTRPVETLPPDGSSAQKRKSSSDPADSHQPAHAKRARLDEDGSRGSRETLGSVVVMDRSKQLPAEIWQRILTLVPPKALGRLLSLNKLFHAFLYSDPSVDVPSRRSASKCIVKPLQPNAIWRQSRLRFMSRIPSPLKGKTELDMWRLVCSRSCQICGRKGDLESFNSTDKRYRGPGAKGVYPVFPFGVALCGSCLLSKSVKEADILSYPIPNALVPGFLKAYITEDGHYVPKGANGELSTSPAFWSGQMEELKFEYESAMSLSPGAAEEWVKGLGNRGKKAMFNVAHWEKWDMDSGVHLMRTNPDLGSLHPQRVQMAASGPLSPQVPSGPQSPVTLRAPTGPKALAGTQAPPIGPRIPTGPRAERSLQDQSPSDKQQQDLEPFARIPTGPKAERLSRSQKPFNHQEPVSAHTDTVPTGPRGERFPKTDNSLEHQQQAVKQAEIPGSTVNADANSHQSRRLQRKTRQQVAELKSKRRAEIELRALLLDPPLTPGVLAHIPSFQAALQITTPLDDDAWELLKPRLIAPRGEAESKEKELKVKAQAVEENSATQEQATSAPKATRTVTDQDWDEAQGPLRGRISEFADEIIRVNWDNGDKVGKKSGPRFAADVLTYVRKKFYVEVAKKATMAAAAGLKVTEDSPEGPWTQKLTLENMKWIFDVKIKPLTEKYRTDLFLCNGCDGNSKYYGLESIIQHYAAKHTTALSNGNVVVCWRAEWPEVPPFRPDGRTQPNQPSSTPTTSTGPQPYPSYPAYPLGSSSTGYPTQGFGAPSPIQPGLPFSAPHSLDPNAPAFGAPVSQGYSVQDPGYPSYPSMPVYGVPAYYQAPPAGYGGQLNPVPYGYSYTSQPDHPGFYNNQPPVDPSVKYNLRLETMIRVARETWNLIEGVSDLPPSVKACVVVHRIAKTFQDDFGEAASLPMFIDGLSNHKDMRPIRSTPGLACKTCSMGHNVYERTDFSLPQLCNHFYKHHVEDRRSQGLAPLDWRIDMISLPEMSLLRNLKKILGDIPPACALVADALPWAFVEQIDYHPTGQQSWSTRIDSPAGGAPLGLDDRRLSQPSPFGDDQKKPEVPRAEDTLSTTEGIRLPQPGNVRGVKTPRHQAPSQSPTYSPEPPNMVPVLKPASEVYKRLDPPIGKVNGRLPVEPGRQSPLFDRHRDATMSHEQRSRPAGHGPESFARPRSPQDYPLSEVRDGRSQDYRDVEPHRYVSRYPPREEDLGPSRRWEEEVRRIRRSSGSYHERLATRPTDDRFNIPYVRPPHFQREHDEVIYLDSSGREVRRAFRPIEARSRTARVVYQDDMVPDAHDRPPSPRYDAYPPRVYHDEDLRPRYEPQSYRHEPERLVHRVYYDDPHRPSRPPVDTSELVRVHDPMGDYYVKRPIHREELEYYEYERGYEPRESEAHLSYSTIRDDCPRRPVEHGVDGRSASRAEARSSIKGEYGEYDPRYPATGGPREDQSRR